MMRITSLNSTSLAKVLSLMYLALAVVFSPFILLMANSEGTGLTEGLFVIFLFQAIYNFNMTSALRAGVLRLFSSGTRISAVL